MRRRQYLSLAAAGITAGVSGCLSVRLGRKHDDSTPLAMVLPGSEALEKYTLGSESEEGPDENNLKSIFREFRPVEGARSPVASRMTAGGAVARDAETARKALSDPVKDALEGEENDVEWVSVRGRRVAKWVDYRQRGVFTLKDANLGIAIAGEFDGQLTRTRWGHLRQHMAGALRRLDDAT